MKTMKNLILLGNFAVALLITATGQQTDTPKDSKQPDARTPNTGEQTPPQPADKPAAETGGKAADNQPAAPPTKEGVSPKNQAQQAQDPAAPAPDGKQTSRLFRNYKALQGTSDFGRGLVAVVGWILIIASVQRVCWKLPHTQRKVPLTGRP